jgi:hypothetical protein
MHVAELFSVWLKHKTTIANALRAAPESDDFAIRSAHDDAIGREIEAQGQLESQIQSIGDGSSASARSKLVIAMDRASIEFGSDLPANWQMVASALGDLELIEACAAA